MTVVQRCTSGHFAGGVVCGYSDPEVPNVFFWDIDLNERKKNLFWTFILTKENSFFEKFHNCVKNVPYSAESVWILACICVRAGIVLTDIRTSACVCDTQGPPETERA